MKNLLGQLPVLRALSPRAQKRVLWAVGLVAGYTVLGFLVAPPIIRLVAVKVLTQQLNREVAIRQVKLNPFAFSTTIRGLLIKDLDGQPFVSWDEVYVNLQLMSFLGHPWVFKEIRTSQPFVRVQLNKDYSFNFSDLIAKFSTNAPTQPSRALALQVDRFQIAGASAWLTDLTPRKPFQRRVGPVDLTLTKFRTDPSSSSPYSISGTTQGGERFRWSGRVSLFPLRSQGDFSLENLSLKQYAALYQDFIGFDIDDGIAGVTATYRFEIGESNQLVSITNTACNLRSLRVLERESRSPLLELEEASADGVSADAAAREAVVGSLAAKGARLTLRRDKNDQINVLEAAKPADPAGPRPRAVLLLLRAVTNAVTLLLNSTNTWRGTIDEAHAENCALSLEDLTHSRPASLVLDQIELSAKHISNVSGTNLSATASARWNTNGMIKADVQASISPLAGEIHLALDRLDLGSLDPFMEPQLNVFITGSKLSMDGRIRVRGSDRGLPEVTFQGDGRLDDFSTVDGELAEGLLRWGSVRVSGIEAGLDPLAVSAKEVAVDDAFARVIIETNHTINLLAALRLGDTNAATGAPEGKPPAPTKQPAGAGEMAAAATNAPMELPKVSIATLVISNAEVQFTDRSVKPNVNMNVQEVAGTLAGLSSETLGHAVLNLQARVDKVGPVEVSGTVNPLSKTETNLLKIAARDVDLTPASPYVGKFAGYRLAQGKLQMDLAYEIQGRNLKSQNVIVLDRFTFGDKVNSPDATKLPVKLAVAILKDRDGKITLDVPIEGSLEDPEFRLRKVIASALVNLLTKVATSPFSLLSGVFGGKGEEVRYQDFAPGSAVLETASKEKLDALAKGFYERPGLQVQINGSVEPEKDRDGLRRAELEKRLRAAKWMSLHKAVRETTTADELTVGAEERSRWLREVYSDAVAKGQISGNPPPAPEAGTNATAESAAPQPVVPKIHPGEPERGATALIARTWPKAASPAPAPGAAAKPTRAAYADALEGLVLESIPVTESDFQALASRRAQAVRDYLVQNGKVELDRVLLAEAQTGGVKSEGSRAYLELQ